MQLSHWLISTNTGLEVNSSYLNWELQWCRGHQEVQLSIQCRGSSKEFSVSTDLNKTKQQQQQSFKSECTATAITSQPSFHCIFIDCWKKESSIMMTTNNWFVFLSLRSLQSTSHVSHSHYRPMLMDIITWQALFHRLNKYWHKIRQN